MRSTEVKLLACDVGSAFVASMMCAPLVSAIDRAITLNASGAGALWPSLLTSLKSPGKILLAPANRWLVFVS